MAQFKLKEQLPIETRQELDRVLAIPSGQRNSVEAEFLAKLDNDYLYNEVITRNEAGEITEAQGHTLPDDNAGFAVGAIFRKVNATAGEPTRFENQGDADEADFIMQSNLVTDGAPQATVQADLTTALTGDNNDLVFTAIPLGVLGNEITIEYVDPEDESVPLSVAVDGNAITVTLETDGNGDIVTLASEIITAIEADAEADALVTVANAGGNDGTGVVTALAATALADGVDAVGMGYAHTGALAVDFDTPALYINTGTKAAPVWTVYPAA